MLQRTKKAITGLALAGAGVALMASAAGAASSISPNSDLQDGDMVAVTITGMPANSIVVLQQCNNDQGADFDPVSDCSFLSLQEVSANAAGSASFSFPVYKEPAEIANGDGVWKCDPSGNPTGTVQSGGLSVYSVCQVRTVAGNFLQTDSSQSFSPFTFSAAPPVTTAPPTTTTPPIEPEPVVPEAPFAVLLPAGGLMAAGAAYLVLRNRKPLAA